MKKLLCLTIAVMLVLSSVSALAAGVAPATGDSPIEVSAEVKVRTINVKFEKAPFDAADDVTFLFYAPESAESNNILEEKIIHADQIDYDANGFSFTVGTDVEAGTYNLLVGGSDVDVPCLKSVELSAAAMKGDLNDDQEVLVADLTKLARFLAEFEDVVAEFDENAALKIAADVNQDDDVTVADLTKLARFLAEFEGVDLNDAN